MAHKALTVNRVDLKENVAWIQFPSGEYSRHIPHLDRNTLIRIAKIVGHRFIGKTPLSYTSNELIRIIRDIAAAIPEGNQTMFDATSPRPNIPSPASAGASVPAARVDTADSHTTIEGAIASVVADAIRNAGGSTGGSNQSITDLANRVTMVSDALRDDYIARFENRDSLLQEIVKQLTVAIEDSKPKNIIVTHPEKPTVIITKPTHMVFPKVLRALKAGENVWMTGMAGVGKTTIGIQCAEALGVSFEGESFCGQSSKSDMKGFKTANGVYESVAFRKQYEEGGVYLLDEVDGANPNILLVLNSALSNGYIGFPDKRVMKHPEFYAIAAANTWGNGATSTYVGRQVIDEATLDRFSMVHVPLDEVLERDVTHMVGLDAETCERWLSVVRRVRHNVESHGLKVSISPRASVSGAKLLHAGFEFKDAIAMRLTKGSSPEIVSKMMQDVIY